MARLNVLEYKADFIRGWPHGSAIEMNYPSATDLGNGDIVKMSGSGTVEKVSSISAGDVYGFVARGQLDTFNGGGTGTGNLYKQVVPNIILWSNFVVRTSTVAAGATLTPGQDVFVDATGLLTNAAGSAEPLGTVLEVETDVPNADGINLPIVATVLVK